MPAAQLADAAPPAIRVAGVSKTFRTWASPAQRLIVPLLHRAGSLLRGAAPELSRRLHASAHRRMHVHEALHDIDFDQGMRPRFFRARMVDGVIDVPARNSSEVKS